MSSLGLMPDRRQEPKWSCEITIISFSRSICRGGLAALIGVTEYLIPAVFHTIVTLSAPAGHLPLEGKANDTKATLISKIAAFRSFDAVFLFQISRFSPFRMTKCAAPPPPSLLNPYPLHFIFQRPLRGRCFIPKDIFYDTRRKTFHRWTIRGSL